jgi:cysteinyl-tRNA synthetase
VALRMYNTRTSKLEEFQPMRAGQVGMYVCGLTPQDFTHVGHARAYVVFDTVRRWLAHKGYRVRYVQNYTDIDDKIIKRAREANVEPSELAERYMEECEYDFGRLNIQPPDIQPRVTEHIDEILELVGKLVDTAYAYATADGSVYFRVKKAKTFGTLTHQKMEEMRSGTRVDADEAKEDPMDFALWKGAKEGEPSWPSRWGKGRPGWHTECSAMAAKYLGGQFDLHGGGIDLIFPHHECEIMQSEAYTGKVPFVNVWLHNGHVTLKEEKMSKSLGNFKTIREVLATFRPEELRFHLLNTQYRKPVEWSPDNLKGDAEAFRRVENTVLELRQRLRKAKGAQDGKQTRVMKGASASIGKAKRAFGDAMDEDFNTRDAIAALFEFVRETNRFLDETEELSVPTLNELMNAFQEMLGILGIRAGEDAGVNEAFLDLVDYLVELREQARKRKDFPTSDSIRDRLGGLGIEVEDGPKGPTWKRRG